MDARKLVSVLQEESRGDGFEFLADSFNGGSGDRISALPGFVTVDRALRPDADKRIALEQMENLNVDWLPVVDANRFFTGVVERSRLTASLILDVANRLEAVKKP